MLLVPTLFEAAAFVDIYLRIHSIPYAFFIREITVCGQPRPAKTPSYRVTLGFGTGGPRRIQVTGDSNYGREMETNDQAAYSFVDVSPVDGVLVHSLVSSVVEEDNSPLSGPASAPSGTPPGFVAVSPTW